MATVFAETILQEKECLIVGMGDHVVTVSPHTVLACIGLGSCIAVCIYDRLVKVGGMAHIVLPRHDGITDSNPGRYANTGVPFLIHQVLRHGGVKNRLIVKIAGGAQMTQTRGIGDTFKTGEKNLTQVIEALKLENIPLAAADTGGTMGRTVKMYLDTGQVTVKTIGGTPKEI